MIRVEVADVAALPAALALLPATADWRARHWVARVDGEVVGAAALQWLGLHDPPGLPVALFVRAGWRRRGVGRALLAAVAAAANGEADGLWSAARHRDDAPAAAFLAACGFAAAQRDLHFRMSSRTFDDHMAGIVARLRRARRIPDGVTTPPLREAPLDRVAMLVAGSFGQPPARVLQRLRLALADPPAARINPDVSTVVMEGDAVVGALLLWLADDVGRIDCNVVVPRRRRSYVNALLLHETTRRGVPHVGWIGFHCDDRLTDTVNLAARGGGELLFSEARYWRPLPQAATTG